MQPRNTYLGWYFRFSSKLESRSHSQTSESDTPLLHLEAVTSPSLGFILAMKDGRKTC